MARTKKAEVMEVETVDKFDAILKELRSMKAETAERFEGINKRLEDVETYGASKVTSMVDLSEKEKSLSIKRFTDAIKKVGLVPGMDIFLYKKNSRLMGMIPVGNKKQIETLTKLGFKGSDKVDFYPAYYKMTFDIKLSLDRYAEFEKDTN